MEAKAIILYDGFCGLCARVVQFVLPRDRRTFFAFAAIQSEIGSSKIRAHGADPAALETFFILADPGTDTERLLSKSTAAFYMLRQLGGVWRLLSWGRILPRVVRDFGYDLVAKRRYRWFGKLDSCAVPKPEWRARFLDG